jgi:tRNA pseudouridine38-40 synthase
MPRYRITVEYDGTSFDGWQIQAHGATVQGALREAISRFCGETVTIQGAGRTDAGVHALGQVAHFDLIKPWAPSRVQDALNFHLRPHPASVLACAEVPPSFDARRSATARRYLYRLMPRRAPPMLEANRVWWVPGALDAVAMNDAAATLIGCHDFTTFRASQCQAASPVRTLDQLEVSRVGDEIHISARARSFLHNQVRSLVGTLKLVGEGRWTRQDVADALAACDRKRCGTVAPPVGLYLVDVTYSQDQNN